MRKLLLIAALYINFYNLYSQTLFVEDFNHPIRESLVGAGGWFRSEENSSFNVNVVATSTEIPKGFYLGQNYPNPFNPVTNIYFSVPEAGNVRLSITDIAGQEISIIVNEHFNAGTYKLNFPGGNLSSGTYFYKLQTASFTNVKKMVLIK